MMCLTGLWEGPAIIGVRAITDLAVSGPGARSFFFLMRSRVRRSLPERACGLAGSWRELQWPNGHGRNALAAYGCCLLPSVNHPRPAHQCGTSKELLTLAFEAAPLGVLHPYGVPGSAGPPRRLLSTLGGSPSLRLRSGGAAPRR